MEDHRFGEEWAQASQAVAKGQILRGSHTAVSWANDRRSGEEK